MSRLIDSDVWAKFVSDAAKGGYVDHGPVFQLRKAPDIADLCQLLTGEPGDTRDAALRILFAQMYVE